MRVCRCLFGLMTLASATAAGPAAAQLVLDDPLNGSTIGTRSGGTFADGGWKVVNNLDSIYWHLAPTVTNGRLEYDIKGLGDGCAGCCYPGDGQPFLVNELSHMYDWTFQNADTNYTGYRNNPYKHAVKRMCYAPPWTMKLLWIADGEGQEDWAGHGLSWNPGTTYRIVVEWQLTGSGTATDFRTYRSGQLVHSIQLPKLYNPLGHSVKIASGLRTEEAAYIGAVYSNVKVYDLSIPLTEVSVDLGAPDVVNGLTHPQVGDGDSTPVTIGGRTGRRNVNPAEDFYFYFAVNDAFAYQGSQPNLHIIIDYYDTGTSSLELQYDSIGSGLGAQYKAGGAVALTGTNTWKSKGFTVNDAWFGNRQNAGADFRIAAPAGQTFYLDVVRVTTEVPVPPIVEEVSPDPDIVEAGALYTRQLVLLQGSPPLSWSLLQGPPGAQVSTGGLVSWTASSIGQEVTFEVEAANEAGADTENWVVRVISRFDFDQDGDVDLQDFAILQRCFSGDGTAFPPGCGIADVDGDADVDPADFNMMLPCIEGASRVPGC